MKLTTKLGKLLTTLLVVLAIASTGCDRSKAVNNLRPSVILISLDGFRYDYLEKYKPPILRSLARDGVQAKWMIPAFPTKTFPNHYTIATGLYPQNNGIVENNIYDKGFNATFTMSNREEVQNGRWWLGEPVWVTAEKQGQKSAAFFWPGSEAEIAGTRSSYWKPYDEKVSNRERVELILSWLDLPLVERPTFLTLYFSDVDSAGHNFSPDAVETRNAVIKVDNDLDRLIDGLKARGIFEQVNLIIVSDHGMTTQDPKNVIVLDELFDTSLAAKILWTPEIVGIFPKAGKENAIYSTLTPRLPRQAKVYRKAELPRRLHYSDSSRIAPLLVLPEEGWALITRKRLDERKADGRSGGLRGGHGYDNELPSMRAIFIAHGSALKKGIVVEPFENIHVYNLMTRILGLVPAVNDGNDTLANAVLEENLGTGR
jgi:predicted AlkP superfamily pyrophosphatase or phosphodiesterase